MFLFSSIAGGSSTASCSFRAAVCAAALAAVGRTSETGVVNDDGPAGGGGTGTRDGTGVGTRFGTSVFSASVFGFAAAGCVLLSGLNAGTFPVVKSDFGGVCAGTGVCGVVPNGPRTI